MNVTFPDTVPAALTRAAERFADRDAVVDGQVRISYTQLATQVKEFAGFLLAKGISHGDRVAICAPNTVHWVRTALATLYIGAVLVPVNTRYTAAETADLLDRTKISALLIVGEFLERDRLAELREQYPETLPALVCTLPASGTDPVELDAFSVSTREIDTAAALVRADDIADILFTSGTTGRSKGAMSAHRQTLGVATAWAENGALSEKDRYLILNPFFHSFGYKAGILACLYSGAAMYPIAVYDSAKITELIAAQHITVLPAAPTVYQELLSRQAEVNFSSLRLAVVGATTVPTALVRRIQTELGFDAVLTGYGLTEAVVVTLCRIGDDPHTVANTCGRAAAGFDIRIEAQPGEPGEVLVRGPNVMLGYLDDPAATAAAVDTAGWLHTGDIGTLDDNGYLRITDRLKDMYISGGFNVYPAEVEQVLAGLDGVTDCAVIGVHDARLGEAGMAFVVRSTHELRTEDVLRHCRSLLANFKVPRHVEFVNTLPRNASGKLLKRQLRTEVT